jgi:hypothetical protein
VDAAEVGDAARNLEDVATFRLLAADSARQFEDVATFRLLAADSARLRLAARSLEDVATFRLLAAASARLRLAARFACWRLVWAAGLRRVGDFLPVAGRRVLWVVLVRVAMVVFPLEVHANDRCRAGGT